MDILNKTISFAQLNPALICYVDNGTNQTIWTVFPTYGKLTVVNITDISSVVATITIPNYTTCIITNGSNVYLGNIYSSVITVIDVNDYNNMSTIATTHPVISMSFKDNGILWFINMSGTIGVIELNNNNNITNYTIPTSPTNLTDIIFSNNYLWIVDNFNNSVYKVEPSSGSVVAQLNSLPLTPLRIVTDTINLWVSSKQSNTVTQISISDFQIVQIFSLSAGPYYMTVSGSYLWITNNTIASVTIIYINGSYANIYTTISIEPQSSAPFGIMSFSNYVYVCLSYVPSSYDNIIQYTTTPLTTNYIVNGVNGVDIIHYLQEITQGTTKASDTHFKTTNGNDLSATFQPTTGDPGSNYIITGFKVNNYMPSWATSKGTYDLGQIFVNL